MSVWLFENGKVSLCLLFFWMGRGGGVIKRKESLVCMQEKGREVIVWDGILCGVDEWLVW